MPRANNDDYDSDMSDDGSSVKKRTSRRNKKDDSEDESIEEVEKKRVRKGKRGKQNDDNDEEKDGEDDGLLGGEKDKGGRKGSGLVSSKSRGGLGPWSIGGGKEGRSRDG